MEWRLRNDGVAIMIRALDGRCTVIGRPLHQFGDVLRSTQHHRIYVSIVYRATIQRNDVTIIIWGIGKENAELGVYVCMYLYNKTRGMKRRLEYIA